MYVECSLCQWWKLAFLISNFRVFCFVRMMFNKEMIKTYLTVVDNCNNKLFRPLPLSYYEMLTFKPIFLNQNNKIKYCQLVSDYCVFFWLLGNLSNVLKSDVQ